MLYKLTSGVYTRGAVAVSLKRVFPSCTFVASDVNERAVMYALLAFVTPNYCENLLEHLDHPNYLE